MPPNASPVLSPPEIAVEMSEKKQNRKRGIIEETLGIPQPLVWYNIFYITGIHLFALYALLTFPFICKIQTLIFGKFGNETLMPVDLAFGVFDMNYHSLAAEILHACTRFAKPSANNLIFYSHFYGSINIFCSLSGFICFLFGGLGVTAGVHRLWSHNSFKAKLPLRIFLLICYSLTGEVRMQQLQSQTLINSIDMTKEV